MLNNDDLQKIGKLILGSEERIKHEIFNEMAGMEKRIITETGKFVADEILPQLDEKTDKHEMDRINNRVDHLANQVGNHEVKIKKLETSSDVVISTV